MPNSRVKQEEWIIPDDVFLRNGWDFLAQFKKISALFWHFIKVIGSLIIAAFALSGMVSMFHFMDPAFSVGMLDLLVQGSPMAWLLLGLAATIVYAVLSRFTLFRNLGIQPPPPPAPNSEQSD